jgi:plastocyanin
MRKVYILVALLVLAVLVAGCAQQSKPEVKEISTPVSTPASTPVSTPEKAEEDHEEGAEAHEEAVVVDEGEPAVTVTLKNFEFSPANIEVKEGQIIEFRNEEGTHTVTIFESGHDEPLVDEPLGPGKSILVKFNEAGSYDLVCKYHKNQMVGRIVVI